jgi:hypothetical protein
MTTFAHWFIATCGICRGCRRYVREEPGTGAFICGSCQFGRERLEIQHELAELAFLYRQGIIGKFDALEGQARLWNRDDRNRHEYAYWLALQATLVQPLDYIREVA